MNSLGSQGFFSQPAQPSTPFVYGMRGYYPFYTLSTDSLSARSSPANMLPSTSCPTNLQMENRGESPESEKNFDKTSNITGRDASHKDRCAKDDETLSDEEGKIFCI